MQSLFPVFVTRKLLEEKNFYCEMFGFSVVFEADWYIQLHFPRASGPPLELAFMTPDMTGQDKSIQRTFSGDGVILTLEFAAVDKIYANLRRQSALNPLVLDLRDEPWGQRHFIFKDPSGILVDVVQQIAPSNEYEAGYTNV